MKLPSYQVLQKAKDGQFYSCGVVSHNEHAGGWRFIPLVSGRISSRKVWETKEQAIPRWVGKDYEVREIIR